MTLGQALEAESIQNGACNPRAIVRVLQQSIDMDTKDGMQKENISPATRLILHQLIYILTGQDVVCGPLYSYDAWQNDLEAVRERIKKGAE